MLHVFQGRDGARLKHLEESGWYEKVATSGWASGCLAVGLKLLPSMLWEQCSIFFPTGEHTCHRTNSLPWLGARSQCAFCKAGIIPSPRTLPFPEGWAESQSQLTPGSRSGCGRLSSVHRLLVTAPKRSSI